METTSIRVDIDVDLFTEGEVVQHGSSMCPMYHTEKSNGAFAYLWVGTSFYRNPVYNADYVFMTLRKAVSDSTMII